MVLSGAGMVLEGGPAGPIPVAGEPVRFSGDWSIVARLAGGPLTDFNLIARRDRLESDMRVETFDAPVPMAPGRSDALVYVLSGTVQAGTMFAAEGEAILLGPGEALELAPLAAPARIIVCRVAPRP